MYHTHVWAHECIRTHHHAVQKVLEVGLAIRVRGCHIERGADAEHAVGFLRVVSCEHG